MGLAAGGYFAGVFHLTTHAAFKALLFLTAGVFIHATGSNDMFVIGKKGGRRLKIPMICMIVGAAALSGLPPLSGFFSKEMILGALAERPNPIWLFAGLAGAFLTAYYTFRLIFIILFPKDTKKDNTEPSHANLDNGHGHSGYWMMAWPLIILAGITGILGFVHGPMEHFLTAVTDNAGHGAATVHHWLLYTALILAGCGVLLAWLEFGRRHAAQVGFAEKIAPLNALFGNRWYLDHFYRWVLDTVVYGGISNLCARNDNQVIDGGIDGLGRATVAGGRVLSRVHLSMIQYRLMIMLVVLALLAVYFFFLN